MQQLTLNWQLNQPATLTHFFGEANAGMISLLQSLPESISQKIIVYGEKSCGKSHLLQACCQLFHQKKLNVMYVPLKQIQSLEPELLQNTEHLNLIAIDDIEQLLNQIEWETALFNLYNQLEQSNTHLLMGTHIAPTYLNCALADLHSRLNACLSFAIQPLNDTEKQQLLIHKAHAVGMILTEEVARFLIQHISRDLASLIAVLQKLEQATLSEKRRLTIPFIKQIMDI